MRPSALPALAAILLFAGCTAVPKPFPDLVGGPQPVTDPAKTFTVFREIKWYGGYPSGSGVVLPTGAYILEAEDDDYWYFHAPRPIEWRIVERGRITERREVSGGILVAKHSTSLAAAAYVDGRGTAKSTIGELSSTEFDWMRGRYWEKNF